MLIALVLIFSRYLMTRCPAVAVPVRWRVLRSRVACRHQTRRIAACVS